MLGYAKLHTFSETSFEKYDMVNSNLFWNVTIKFVFLSIKNLTVTHKSQWSSLCTS